MLVCILHNSIITIFNIYATILSCPRFKSWKGKQTKKTVCLYFDVWRTSVHTSTIKSSKISVDFHLIKEK